jgi:hypothetical protein
VTGQVVRTLVITVFACLSLSAQTTGPHSTSYHSDGYPARTCKNFPNNVCVLAQVCNQFNGTCSGANGVFDPSVGGPGGVGNHGIFVSTNGGGYVGYTSNSTAKSQGFIVVIGSSFDSYTFSPNASPQKCPLYYTFAGGSVGSGFKPSWSPGNQYYKVLMQCQ